AVFHRQREMQDGRKRVISGMTPPCSCLPEALAVKNHCAGFMNPEQAVEIASAVIESEPNPDEEKLKESLAARGVQAFIADQLVVLVPLAFSRAHFEGLPFPKQYWDYFLLVDQRTKKEEKHRLGWNPFFCA